MSGNTVVVMSIPYDQTEEQVLDVFKSVGPVHKFKMQFDEETGRSQGVAFVKYFDDETAASARRNLNGYEIGGRTLRVKAANRSPFDDDETTTNSLKSSSSRSSSKLTYEDTSIESLPSGKPLARGAIAAVEITKTIESYSVADQQEILAAMKKLANSNRQLTSQLLDKNPQLSYAIVQILLALGLLGADGVSDLVVGGAGTDGGDTVEGNSEAEAGTHAGVEAQAGSEPEKDDQIALIRQVMQLTEDQIAALPEEQRQALVLLKQKVESGEIQI